MFFMNCQIGILLVRMSILVEQTVTIYTFYADGKY
jgi:hypothetical protein